MNKFNPFFYLKPLKKLKRSIFLTLLVVLCSGMAMAQTLSGGGTSSNPYKIYSAADWAIFTNPADSAKYWASNKYVILMNDIPTAAEIEAGTTAVTTMVGVWSSTGTDRRQYHGKFNGDGHTIKVNYENKGKYTAVFSCTNGAEIKLLSVDGTITTTEGYAAGVIGINYASTTKYNGDPKFVSVDITNGSGGSAGEYCAGVVVDGYKVEINGTVYNGKIIAGNNSAGFCAVGYTTTKVMTSVFAPKDGSSITGTGIQNFIANDTYYKEDNKNICKENYYTYKVGSSTQWTRAYKTYSAANTAGAFTKYKQLRDNKYYYVEGTKHDINARSQYYLNNATNGGLTTYTIAFKELDFDEETFDSSYCDEIVLNSSSESVPVASITTGTYTLSVTGKENYCTGTWSVPFTVVANISLDGNGTEASPYLIKTRANWNTFANYVNNDGESFDRLYVKLDKDITINVRNTGWCDKMVGDGNGGNETKWFSGTFDGDFHTLTFNAGPNDTVYNHSSKQPAAPFRVIDGATIKNLNVTGKIYTSKVYNAGLVGYSFGAKTGRTNNITSCTVSVDIDCSQVDNGSGDKLKRWDCSAAGFACENKIGGKISFDNCIFDGSIDKKTNAQANRGAGFVAYNNEKTKASITYTHCLMMGYINLYSDAVITPQSVSTFSRNGYVKYNSGCLYGPDYGEVSTQANCSQASTTEPEPNDGIYRKYTVKEGEDNVDYYVSEVIVEPKLQENMNYPGEPIVITLTYYGRQLVAGTDYTIVIKHRNGSTGEYETVSTIDDEDGAYKVKIDGNPEKSFYGTKEYEFRFMSEDEKWYNLENLINNANDGDSIILTHNYYGSEGDSVLKINKNLKINLNGYTIDRGLTTAVERGQVIRISAGNTVKIYNGTITGGYNRARDDDSAPNSNTYDYKNDAGGIYNMGTLVLKDVHVVGNKCIKYTDLQTNSAATARGGGIYTGKGSSFTMIGGSVSNNEAKGGGGGVYCYQPTSFSMTGVEISHNDSESKGGGIRIRALPSPADTVCLVNCNIKFNRATEKDLSRGSDGGGVYMQEGLLKMDGCTIGGGYINDEEQEVSYGNQSAFAGAGFYQLGGFTRSKNCTISFNSAYTEHDRMYGGGICIKAGTYLMDGGTVTNNHSYRDGGGVYIYHGGHFQVKGKVTITDNLRTRPGAVPENTINNAYPDDGAVIEIVGDITSDSKIHITGHGYGGTYTSGKENFNVPDGVIEPDGKYQLVTMDEQGNPYVNVRLEPYEWYKGAWGDDTPTITSTIVINKAVELEPGEIGYADYIRYVNGSIILKDGSQLICKDGLYPDSPPVEALIQKKIKAFDSEDGGWYAITIPTDTVKIWDSWEHNTNLVEKNSDSGTDSNMDLLRFDEPHGFWDSYTDISAYQNSYFGPFTHTENGRGYLYRYREDRDLSFYGFINLGDVTYRVHADNSGNAKLQGWNIIGNPYCHDVYKGDDKAIPNGDLLDEHFYRMKLDGAWEAQRDNIDVIGVCQGILVHAKTTGDLVMHSIPSTTPDPDPEPGEKRGGEKNVENSIKFTVTNSTYEDVAYALFDKGTGLMKVDHINEDIQVIYIRHNDADYAIASLEDNTRSFDLGFGAKTLSSYTLTVDIEGEFNYLHLIDKLTEQDIDLLSESKYEFIGSSADSQDRFIVRMSKASDTDIDEFAYQSGNDIIVCGYGKLQMFDMAGRLISTQYVNGVESVNKPSQSGVYILRLLGTDVKTQKIVVK